MTDLDEVAAKEQLKLIRGLIERATIFRALSGETALVGGLAALAAAWFSAGSFGWQWAGWWLGFLALVMIFNAVQIGRRARQYHKPWLSGGLKIALRGSLPSIIAGGFLGLLYVRAQTPENDRLAACFWILHYGLALWAIREFAPRSMKVLAWVFVVAGIVALAGLTGPLAILTRLLNSVSASLLMAICFGGFHLVYAVVILVIHRRTENSA